MPWDPPKPHSGSSSPLSRNRSWLPGPEPNPEATALKPPKPHNPDGKTMKSPETPEILNPKPLKPLSKTLNPSPLSKTLNPKPLSKTLTVSPRAEDRTPSAQVQSYRGRHEQPRFSTRRSDAERRIKVTLAASSLSLGWGFEFRVVGVSG